MSDQTTQLIQLLNEKKTCNEICYILNLSNKQLFNNLTNLKNKGFVVKQKYYSNGVISYKPIFSLKELNHYLNTKQHVNIITSHEEKEFNVLKGTIPDFGYDIKMLSVVVDDKKETTIPARGYYKTNVDCTNGTRGEWDYNAWNLTLENVSSNAKCNITFTSNLSEEEYNKYIEAGVSLRRNSYGTHIPYYFKTLDIINFGYKINTNITIGTQLEQEKVHIDKLDITLSLGL